MAHFEMARALEGPQHQAVAAASAGVKVEKARRPTLQDGVTEADWVWFMECWRRYKIKTKVEGDQVISELWECCSSELGRRVYESGIPDKVSEVDLLAAMKKMAIKNQNKLVNVVEFLSMSQEVEEPISTFASRLRGQGKICNFSVTCTRENCNTEVSYLDSMLCHQMVRGLVNTDTQEKVLALAAQEDITVKRVTEYVEAQEMGARSSKLISGATINKVSDYQRGRSNTLPSRLNNEKSGAGSETADKCSYCGRRGHGRNPSIDVRKQRCGAWDKKCNKCSGQNHFANVCKQSKTAAAANTVQDEDEEETTLFNMFMGSSSHKRNGQRILSHMACDQFGKWTQRNPEPQPSVNIDVAVSRTSYRELSLPEPRHHNSAPYTALPDTGAQVVVAGTGLIHVLGVKKHELIPVSQKILGANQGSLKLLGGILVDFSAVSKEGVTKVSKELCYIAEGVNRLLLSRRCCINLGIINKDFPSIGSNDDKVTVNNCDQAGEGGQCSCPKRTATPPAPSQIPFPATLENVTRLKQWILDHYASSAFNCCQNQELPLVNDTAPMSLHVDPKAKPVAFHKPYNVPVHWREQVKDALDRDVRLGVLEKVPVGEATTWCSRMVLVAKKDGTPRRTVDYQHLNKAMPRQTNPVKAPFEQAMSIPAGTYRTCLDAWNGFHSIPLAEDQRHYTTFITPWGRYRYKTLPQGLMCATDGYTERYDFVTRDVEDSERCVDDTCLYDETIEGNFFATCKYLSLCGSAGIVFSAKKFQFCSKEVEFLGFKVDKEGVKPSEDFLKAIRDFPTPRDITGIRSWFGLVEQSSYAFSKTDVMLPFRHLLKPSSKFEWTDELEEAFTKSKVEIIKRIEDGIRTFDPRKVTCLAPDFCKTGIGFHLLQKNCTCSNITPVCCKSGWSIVFAGSRFTNQAEQRYAPIEGECLAAAWAMAKCKYFLIGCESFVLAVDHKPLLGILSDRSLEEIENPRLQRLKEKTLRFKFTTCYVPGRLHKTADAASRGAVSAAEEGEALSLSTLWRLDCDEVDTVTVEDEVEGLAQCVLSGLFNAVSVEAMNASALTWDQVKEASNKDKVLAELRELLESGADGEWPQHLMMYHTHRKHLSVQRPVVFYKERIVVPASLRSAVLEVLHSGHGGVSSMMLRAGDSVWWPGLHADIEKTRQSCHSCDVCTPSQPAAPPTPLPSPAYPFEQICADYFSHGSHKYLVIVDRFSNWITVFKIKKGDGAEVLVKLLRQHFLTFGASSELASDGGLEFVSSTTQNFLRTWGVHHRLSSAYHPHSNQRSELGVKLAKRLIRENTDGSGNLHNDKFARALLNYRNTPCRDMKLSPAQIIYGRNIRDHLAVDYAKLKPRKEWLLTQEQREVAMSRRYERMEERLRTGTKVLPRLEVGNIVSIQNQTGPRAKKWDKTGTIVEILPYNQFRIRVDGSGNVTLRNRQFIRKIGAGNSHDALTQPLPRAEHVEAAYCGHLHVHPPHGGGVRGRR